MDSIDGGNPRVREVGILLQENDRAGTVKHFCLYSVRGEPIEPFEDRSGSARDILERENARTWIEDSKVDQKQPRIIHAIQFSSQPYRI